MPRQGRLCNDYGYGIWVIVGVCYTSWELFYPFETWPRYYKARTKLYLIANPEKSLSIPEHIGMVDTMIDIICDLVELWK